MPLSTTIRTNVNVFRGKEAAQSRKENENENEKKITNKSKTKTILKLRLQHKPTSFPRQFLL